MRQWVKVRNTIIFDQRFRQPIRAKHLVLSSLRVLADLHLHSATTTRYFLSFSDAGGPWDAMQMQCMSYYSKFQWFFKLGPTQTCCKLSLSKVFHDIYLTEIWLHLGGPYMRIMYQLNSPNELEDFPVFILDG